MPSLFSRARTNSTPHKTLPHHIPDSLDEFGRVSSRLSARAISSPTPSKKDRKKAKNRAKTLGNRADHLDSDSENQPPPIPDGSFLPLNLEPPLKNDPAAGDHSKQTDYGYLAYERHVVLGLDQLEVLVNVVADELETRGGITTPFIFSTTALDISASAIKRLIRSFLNMCSTQASPAFDDPERAWREEARFAGPHELGMCLRWGLARVVRVAGGMDVRGLVAWEDYVKFRDAEAGFGYHPAHFENFLQLLNPTLQIILVRILTLLSRLTANSTSSGHTPPTLSPLFGPLLFGLGPATLAFHHTYVHYLRAVNATEHIMLAFIRWQDMPPRSATSKSNATHPSGSTAGLGVPIRLKEWIKGYPAMLPFLHEPKNVKPHPRKGAKTVTMTTVRRNVRMYSPDLVKTAATWATRTKPGNGVINGLANSKEWERIAPATLKLSPRYSELYKKRMNMPPNFYPETAPGMAYSVSSASSTASSARAPTLASSLTIGTVSQPTSASDKDYFGLDRIEGEDRFRSLTDLKWGEFESMGFSSIGDDKKLQFDLTEGAREARAVKRQTMSWNDFSAAGFSRTDAPLNATLQFSTPLALSVSNWPSRDAELTKKIKKTEKQLPPFGWDTEPVMGNEEVVEEAFVDVFCDLVYGGGWMDLERGEGLDRDVNWALVEFKSLPPNRNTASGGTDPRTAATLILFEEFVPFEYRQQLAIKSTTRRRLPKFFSPSKKQWKQAATLNGRPYVVGHVPRSPSYREMEFEGLLQPGSGTKVISLGSKASTRVVSTISAAPTTTTTAENHRARSPPPPVPPLPPQPSSLSPSTTGALPNSASLPPLSIGRLTQAPPRPPKSDEIHSDATTMSPSVKKPASRFKITNVINVSSPKRLSMIPPAEYSPVNFETRLASYSGSEGRNSDEGRGIGNSEEERKKQKKRESRDDAWVDILVNSHQRRIVGQDVDPNALKPKGGDPDMAGLEVAQVLAAVRRDRERSPSLGSNSTGGVDFLPHHSHEPSAVGGVDMDAHVQGLEIDEIERIPHRSRRRRGGSVGSSTSGGHGRLAYNDEDEDGDDEDEEYAADDEDHDAEHSQDLSHSHAHEAEPTGMEHVVPGVQEGQEPESLLSVRHALRQQRRLGYFDMHPERKQLYSGDNDPDEERQMLSAMTGGGSSPSPDVPSFETSSEQRRAEMEKIGVVRADSVVLPSPPPLQPLSAKSNGNVTSPGPASANGAAHPIGPRAPASATAAGAAGTKTAALIEMYRERERRAAGAPASATLPGTALTTPVVTTTPPTSISLPVPPPTVAAAVSTTATPPPNPPARTASLPGATNPNTSIGGVEAPDSTLIELPKVPVDETGRASPARYVHGAPLHNVLEEEEEE